MQGFSYFWETNKIIMDNPETAVCNVCGKIKSALTCPHCKSQQYISKNKFLNNIEHRRISVFNARIGQKAMKIALFDGVDYRPHLVEETITLLYYDEAVSDFSGYYTLAE